MTQTINLSETLLERAAAILDEVHRTVSGLAESLFDSPAYGLL